MITAKSSLLPILGIAAALLLAPRLSVAFDGVEPYCCVCTGCTTGTARQCISVLAEGTRESDCTNRCGAQSCQFLEVLDGSCNLHAAECSPAPAPAASRLVLFALAALLVGSGVHLARRRVTH